MKKYIFLVFLYSSLLAQKKNITLSDIWIEYKFYPATVEQFRWMKDDKFYTGLSGGNKLFKYNVLDKSFKETLLEASNFKDPFPQKIQDYEFSNDESFLLLKSKVAPIYRHSSKEVSTILDLKTKNFINIYDGKQVSHATLSPNNQKVAFVYENNLFVQDINSKEITRITKDGEKNKIIYGFCDWVYEEEFSFTKAFEWSPDGKKIAFYRFDESQVPEFSMEIYGELYPKQERFKYPKAGEKNSEISIYVYDLESKSLTPMDLGSEKDIYIPRIRWTNTSEQLAVLRMNRLQNSVDVLLCNTGDGSHKIILSEKSDTYIEVTDYLLFFLENGKEFLWTSEKDGFNHIYHYDLNGKLVRQITSGNFEVQEILGVDNKKQMIYYLSSEVSPLEKHFYQIGFNGKNKKRLSNEPGNHSITISSSFNYYIDTYSQMGIPPSTKLMTIDGKLVKEIETNKDLKERLETYEISKPEFFKFKTSEGVELNGWMIKPLNFDENKKYPVLMYCYGGPGHQTVINKYSGTDFFWYQMLASQGYIIVSIDNRGTGGRGAAFKKATYKQLGKLECIDQIEGAKYLGSLKYVDKTRIGIWGWSFGGYLTSLCLTKGNEYFKAGIAVAPVTNWRYYDTIYTERYLQRPQDNPSGYDENSPINFADKLKGNYLLVHGTADDNVHFQNAMEMVDALVKNNKQFEQFFYPNKNHGIYGGVTRYHLYTKLTKFILGNI